MEYNDQEMIKLMREVIREEQQGYLNEDYIEMVKLFREMKNIPKAIRLLGLYMADNGFTIHEDKGTLFHKTDEGFYEEITIPDATRLLIKELGVKIGVDDVDKARPMMTNPMRPSKNIVQFNNVLYDMESLSFVDIINNDEPVVPNLKIDYDFHKVDDDEQYYIKDFLTSSLPDERLYNGLLEIIGYLFVSGNPENILPVICGIQGSGKSVLGNILEEIFGGNQKVCNVRLQDIGDPRKVEPFGWSNLNLIRDSPTQYVEDVGGIKATTGNESIQIKPMYKSPYFLKAEEVPKTIVTANEPPKMKDDNALSNRLIIIPFERKFRGTNKQIKNLDSLIINSKEDMEWLIYHSIMSYRKMIANHQRFRLKMDANKTDELYDRMSRPLHYILLELFEGIDPDHDEEYDDVVVSDAIKVIELYASENGKSLSLGKANNAKSRKILSTLKYAFEVEDGYYMDDGFTFVNSYSSKVVKRNNKPVKIYPYLIPSKTYTEYLDKIKEGDKK